MHVLHYGRNPPDLASDVMLPTDVLQSLETEDDLLAALEQRQITEYSSQISVPELAPDLQPPFTPTQFSNLTLGQSFEFTALQNTSSTSICPPNPDAEPDREDSEGPIPSAGGEGDSQSQSDGGSPPRSPLLPLLGLGEDEDSYNLDVAPLIVTERTPHTYTSLPSSSTQSQLSGRRQLDLHSPLEYFKQVQCSYCTDKVHYPQSSLVQVDAYGANQVRYFCIRTDYCKLEADREKIRLEAFHNLHKQGKAMIESSSKRHKPLQLGDDVRIPIPIVDRAPIGPLSLLATVTNISQNAVLTPSNVFLANYTLYIVRLPNDRSQCLV